MQQRNQNIKNMEEKANRVLHVEINDDVRKLTIEGVDKDQQVVMRQELNEDELDNVTGGASFEKWCRDDNKE